MKRSEIRLLWLLALIVIVAGGYLGLKYLSESDNISGDGADSIASRYSIPASDTLPPMQMELLLAEKQETSQVNRNIFAFSRRPTPVSRPVVERPAYEEIAEDAEEDLPELIVEESHDRPQLRGYDYIGFQQASNGFKRAVFRWRGRTFVGMEGMVINAAFKIIELKPKSAVIQVLAGDFRQVLDLNDPTSR